MAEGHQIAICPAVHNGLQARLRQNTTPHIFRPRWGANRLFSASSRQRYHGGGGRGPFKKGCNRASLRKFSRFLLFPIIGAEERGGEETSHQLEAVERIFNKETISYDHPQGGGPVNSTGRLVHYNRPAGCISSCSSAQGISHVPQIYMEGQDLSVSETSFRTDIVSTSLYRHHYTFDGTLQNQRHQSDFLPGRYFGSSELKNIVVQHIRLCAEPVVASGVQTQPKEMSVDSITEFSIPRIGMEYNDNGSFTPTDKTRSNSSTDRSFTENAYGLHERLYGAARQDEFCDHSNSIGSLTLSTTTILPTTTHEQSESYRITNLLVKRSSRLSALVDVANKEWTKFKDESTNISHYYGRIPDGMGGSNGPTVHTGPVDGRRQVESYQLPRTENGINCSSVMAIPAEKPDSFVTDGQYDSCGLPPEGGRHTVQVAALPSSRNIDIGRSAEYISTTKLLARPDEYAGRCAIAVEGGRRIDVSTSDRTTNILDLRPTSGGSICIREEQTTTSVLLHGSVRSPLPEDRRFTP